MKKINGKRDLYQKLKLINQLREDPEKLASIASMVIEMAEFREKELTGKNGKIKIPSVFSFKRHSMFKAFFIRQTEKAHNIIKQLESKNNVD